MSNGFGLVAIREAGASIDPIYAVMYTGPGATPEWFRRQQKAFFDHQRSKGCPEEDLMKHPYYLAPDYAG